jgi:uncharacterized membrane protein YfcA
MGAGYDALVLVAAAGLAGLIDAVVGGGGLIQIPALFSVYPEAAAASLFGTNKCASILGTASAAWRYSRHIEVPWRAVLPAALAAFLFSYLGAMTVALLPREVLRPLILVMLVAVAGYIWWRKDFGRVDQYRRHGRRDMAVAVLLGGAIGFYDGFFGPGAGSFLIFLFIRFFGLDFVRASSAAKIVNVATNGAALLYFLPHGNALWGIAGLMAAANIAGAQLGARLALRHGAGFVRVVFLGVVTALIGKFGYDTLF